MKMNLPNKLSILRICIVPIMSIFYVINTTWSVLVAIALFLLAVVTDFLDGNIARRTNQVTSLGKLLDPIADKFLVCCALFLIVEYNIFSQQLILPVGVGAFCCALIISRELLVSIVRQIGASNGVVIHANKWGKIKAIFQYISIPILMLLTLDKLLIGVSSTLYQVLYWLGIVTFAIATVLTIISAIIYIIENKNIFKNINK